MFHVSGRVLQRWTPLAKFHEHDAPGKQLIVGRKMFVARRLVVRRPPLNAAVGDLGGNRSATTSREQASSVRQAGQRTLPASSRPPGHPAARE